MTELKFVLNLVRSCSVLSIYSPASVSATLCIEKVEISPEGTSMYVSCWQSAPLKKGRGQRTDEGNWKDKKNGTVHVRDRDTNLNHAFVKGRLRVVSFSALWGT